MGIYTIPESDTDGKKRLATCQENPIPCIDQLAFEAIALSLTYVLLVHVAQGTPPTWSRVAAFVALWVSISFVYKFLGFSFHDKLSIAAGVQIGHKLFGLLA